MQNSCSVFINSRTSGSCGFTYVNFWVLFAQQMVHYIIATAHNVTINSLPSSRTTVTSFQFCAKIIYFSSFSSLI